MVRRVVATLVTVTTLAVGVPAAAQTDGGSLTDQLIAASESSLGDQATIAVLQAMDNGYDLLQVIEALLEGLVAPDGSITDEEGAPVAPTSAPTGLIVDDGSGAPAGGAARGAGDRTTPEGIAIGLLEIANDKTERRLDKKHDLGARAADYGAGLDVFTMIAVLVLWDVGYSTEQIIVDGLLDNGIDFAVNDFTDDAGIVIRDRDGKVLRPDRGRLTFGDDEETATVNGFIDDLADAVTGEDPLAVSDNSFKRQYTLSFDVTFTDDEGGTGTVTGKANLGELKELTGRLGGRGTATLVYENQQGCSLSEGDTTQYPYSVKAPLRVGVFGNGKPGHEVTLELAVVATGAATVTGDESALCIEVVRDTADFYAQLITFPKMTVTLRDGQRGGGTNQGSDEPFTVTTVVKVKEI